MYGGLALEITDAKVDADQHQAIWILEILL